MRAHACHKCARKKNHTKDARLLGVLQCDYRLLSIRRSMKPRASSSEASRASNSLRSFRVHLKAGESHLRAPSQWRDRRTGIMASIHHYRVTVRQSASGLAGDSSGSGTIVVKKGPVSLHQQKHRLCSSAFKLNRSHGGNEINSDAKQLPQQG